MIHLIFIYSLPNTQTLNDRSTPTYYVPEPLVSKLEKAREAMSQLDGAHDDTVSAGGRNTSLMSMNVIGVKPGDEIYFSPKKCGK